MNTILLELMMDRITRHTVTSFEASACVRIVDPIAETF